MNVRRHEVWIDGVRHSVTDKHLRRLLTWIIATNPFGTSIEVASAYARQSGQAPECARAALLLAQQLGFISGPADGDNPPGYDGLDTSDGGCWQMPSSPATSRWPSPRRRRSPLSSASVWRCCCGGLMSQHRFSVDPDDPDDVVVDWCINEFPAGGTYCVPVDANGVAKVEDIWEAIAREITPDYIANCAVEVTRLDSDEPRRPLLGGLGDGRRAREYG